MTLETEGEHDKNRELFSCGHTRGGRADRKTQNSSQIHARAQPGLFFSLRILDQCSQMKQTHRRQDPSGSHGSSLAG